MYQVLYRKYRPKVFDDVFGQNHVTSTLSKEIRDGKLAHAYLFTGSRGTGKTTCARILAKAVNCLHPSDGNPCNECEICRGIDNGSVLDVIEIDAASNRGVDNIRDLRDEANFTPSKAKYRIYIIDEVHMLTIEAFNALLKTLEEPPEHVKFILATTEIHKLPSTILSRCQRFDFRRITPEDITKRLFDVSRAEGITLEKDAAMLIARIADGGMRDALSLLDQCACSSESVTVDTVASCAGLANRDYLFKLSDAITKKDCTLALKTVDEIYNASCDMQRLCEEMTNHFRNLLVAKTLSNPQEVIICTDEELSVLKKHSDEFTLEEILYCLSVFEQTSGNIKKGVNRRVEVEMSFIKLCSPRLDNSFESLASRITAIENKLSSGKISVLTETNSNHVNIAAEKSEDIRTNFEEKNTSPKVEDEKVAHDTVVQKEVPFEKWNEVLSLLSERNKPLSGLLAGTSAVVRGECIGIKSNNAALGKFIRENSYRNVILQAIYDVTGKKYRLAIAHGNRDISKQSQKKDPLDGLIEKLDNLEIDFKIN